MSDADQLQRQLLVDRVVTVFELIDVRVAERVMGQLLYLEEIDAEREITLSLSSPGGSITAGLQVLQVVAQLGPPLRTICLARCGGIATLLLAAGTRGSRLARHDAHISLDKLGGQPAEVPELQLEQLRRKLQALASALTGQPADRVAQDFERELELTAEGARKYGLVDEVVLPQG